MDDPYGAYAGGYGDYTGGDMYGDYMANEYTPAAGGTAAAAATLQVWCRTAPAICRTSPIYPPCRVTQVYNSRCCSPRITVCPTRCCTLPQITPCRVTIQVICQRPTLTAACGGLQTLQCGINPGGNFDAGYYDPYGEYGY